MQFITILVPRFTMNIKREFISWNNLEFTLNIQDWYIRKKVLYRSFNEPEAFKKQLFSHLLKNVSWIHIKNQIRLIFNIPETIDLVFHYWEDPETNRIKFYISLYHCDFRTSITIISQLKKILNIDSYILDKNFSRFDCLGFDIYDKWILLKVYELIQPDRPILSMLPEYISETNIKEVGILKSGHRKKFFFRLREPQDISNICNRINGYQDFLTDIWELYDITWKMTYYCTESENSEIYFI